MKSPICRLLLPALIVALSGTANASPRTDWRLFRDHHPYHAQAIAFGPADARGARTIVISEPPPEFSFREFASRYSNFIQGPFVATQQIGFDGWVKDIVGVVGPMSEAQRQTLVEDLSRDLFGTAYKAYWIDISDERSPNDMFDLSVGANALRDWLGLAEPTRTETQSFFFVLAWMVGLVALVAMVKRRRINPWLSLITGSVLLGYWTTPSAPVAAAGVFHPLHGGDDAPLARLLADPVPGVYSSEKPGLVALVIRRSNPLNEATVALREFALDSDLILGGIGTANAVAVIGRERQASVKALPPLRTETLLQLAAADTNELAQSYERTRVFAGSTGPDHRDWAPIFLSPQLHDTEYGSLLNITDQLLKSWSEHGEIEYVNFHYPKPPDFPFETGLLEHAKVNVVTYNWNTKGVGYSDDHDGYDVVAFSRTGALPVDYLGEQDARMRADEEKGYEYFAGTTHDPNLARVVQYAGIYQIWRHFEVRANWSAPSRSHDGADALLPLARELIRRVKDLDVDSARSRFADDPDFLKELVQFEKLQTALTEAAAASGDTFDESLAHYLVYPRDYPANAARDRQHVFRLSHEMSSNSLVRLLARRAIPIAFRLYATAEGREDPAGWIKTPSVVLSWQVGKNAGNGEGGHNLSSRTSHFVQDASLTPGSVRVTEVGGERVLYYHPDDAGKIGNTARPFARNLERDPEELVQTVEAQLRSSSADNRAMRDALNLVERPMLGSRGFAPTPGVSFAPTPPWIVGGRIPAAHADALSTISEASIFGMVIERSDRGFLLSRAGQTQVVEAANTSSAFDAVAAATRTEANGRTVHLHFKNMNEDQAKAFSQVAEMHGADGRPVTLRTSVEMPDARSIQVLGEIKNGKWKLADAEITPVNARTGELRNSLDFDLAVRSDVGRSLKVRIKVVLEKAVNVTTELIGRVTEALRAALAGVALEADMLVAARRVMQTLRESDETIRNVHIRIVGEAGEIDVVRNVLAAPDALGE